MTAVLLDKWKEKSLKFFDTVSSNFQTTRECLFFFMPVGFYTATEISNDVTGPWLFDELFKVVYFCMEKDQILQKLTQL